MPKVFADGDEFHFRRDDAKSSVMHLRYTRAAFSAQRRPLKRGEAFQFTDVLYSCSICCLKSKITVIDRACFTTFVFLDVTTPDNPFAPERRQSLGHVALKIRIAPGTARVVNANGRVFGQRAVDIASGCLPDLATRDTHTRLGSIDVNSLRVWQRSLIGRLQCFIRLL